VNERYITIGVSILALLVAILSIYFTLNNSPNYITNNQNSQKIFKLNVKDAPTKPNNYDILLEIKDCNLIIYKDNNTEQLKENKLYYALINNIPISISYQLTNERIGMKRYYNIILNINGIAKVIKCKEETYKSIKKEIDLENPIDINIKGEKKTISKLSVTDEVVSDVNSFTKYIALNLS
jgi:hypothetical protein